MGCGPVQSHFLVPLYLPKIVSKAICSRKSVKNYEGLQSN
jgi:hypothetical protein